MTGRLLRTAACAAAICGALAAAAPAAQAPSRLLVSAREWSLTLSRPSVKAGPAIVQLANRGEDAHDLRLRRLDRRGRMTGRSLTIAEVRPGELGELEGRLARGRWRLYCTLPGHAKLGMKATLRAR